MGQLEAEIVEYALAHPLMNSLSVAVTLSVEEDKVIQELSDHDFIWCSECRELLPRNAVEPTMCDACATNDQS